MSGTIDWGTIQWDYRHLVWNFDPVDAFFFVEAVDQYGRWYYVSIPQASLKDTAIKQLQVLDKKRQGIPVLDKNIIKGRWDGRKTKA